MPGIGKSDTTPPDNPGPPRFKVPVSERVASLTAKIREMPDFTEPEGDTFVVTSGPFDIVKDGEIIGYEVWVKHFDGSGYEIDIDPHRQFIYPPDGSYLDQYGVRQRDVSVEAVARGMLSRTIRQTTGRES